jgi:hypothetical protein
LVEIKGMGSKRLAQYGVAILALVQGEGVDEGNGGH